MPRGRPQHPLAGSAAGPGNAPAPVRGEGRAGVRARQPPRPRSSSTRRTRASASSPPASATSTCCRRWKTWASTTTRAARHRHPRVQGRHDLAAGAASACATSRAGCEDILVVEEKRASSSSQMKEQMYNWRPAQRPRVVGKYDEAGEWILPSHRRADAGAHRARDRQAHRSASSRQRTHRATRLRWMAAKEAELALPRAQFPRVAALLLGLPAQHLDRGAGRLARARPASAATTWRPGWTAAPTPSRRWAAKA